MCIIYVINAWFVNWQSLKVFPHGLYTSFLIPTTPWIDMNFVLGFPSSEKVVDRFTKMTYFIPCHKSDNALHMVNLFFREVVRIHGLLWTIMLGRDSKFLGHFWRSLWSKIRTKLLYSNTCHPQMEGQTKIGKKWISCVEFAYNRVFNTITSYSPFELAMVITLSPLNLFPLHVLPNYAKDEDFCTWKGKENNILELPTIRGRSSLEGRRSCVGALEERTHSLPKKIQNHTKRRWTI
ncbi:hypothetical protein CR513_22607, partial [Mucuna pruriens]